MHTVFEGVRVFRKVQVSITSVRFFLPDKSDVAADTLKYIPNPINVSLVGEALPFEQILIDMSKPITC
jgi:hypothetical protein